MEELRATVFSIIIAGITATFATLSVPGKKNSGIIKAITGVFVMLCIFQPFRDIVESFSDETGNTEYIEQRQEEISENINDESVKILKNEIERYASDAAKRTGVKIVSVNSNIECKEKSIIIHNIFITLERCSSKQKEQFKNLTEEKTGIPVTVDIRE